MKKVVVIGQALPLRATVEPFGRTRLYAWLERIGIQKAEVPHTFFFTALLDFFPGIDGRSHKVPTDSQIKAAYPRLRAILQAQNPDVVIPLGSLAIREILGRDSIALDAVVGKTFRVDPLGALGRTVLIIPLPHPSGASVWIHLGTHMKLLDRGLGHLRRALSTPSKRKKS